jgi:hypothetical protein
VVAPGRQVLNGRLYAFGTWSDGGAGQHTVVVPPAPSSLTATYTDVGLPVYSLQFDGTNDVVRTVDFPQTGSFTIEAWIKRTASGGKDQVILSDGNALYSQAMWTLLVDGGKTGCPSDGEIAFHQRGDTQQCSGVVAQVGQWYHVAVSRDARGVRRRRCTRRASPLPARP